MARKIEVVSYAFIFIVILVLAIWFGFLWNGITGQAILEGDCECSTSAMVEMDSCETGYVATCNGPVECSCVLAPTLTCNDQGNDLMVKETCTDPIDTIEDRCEGVKVIQYECDEDGLCGRTNEGNAESCSSGYSCSDGACTAATDCYGTATTCSSITSELTCGSQIGCIWTSGETIDPPIAAATLSGTCGGTATACSTITAETNCLTQEGCLWQGGVTQNETDTNETDTNETDVNETDTNITIDGCIDSDGGANQNIFGTCVDQFGTWEDYCDPDASSPVVHEYACHANNLSCAFYNRGCTPNICVDGVCVEPGNGTAPNGSSPGLTTGEGEEDTFFDLLRGTPDEDEPYRIDEGEECRANECELNEKCYPLGYRNRHKQYCAEDATWAAQLEGGCSNHFECESNICVEGMCVKRAFIQRAIARFGCIFTGEKCKGTGGYFVRLFGNGKAM